MNIYFYNCMDDHRKVHKTLNNTNLIDTLSGTIKDNCLISDPVIEVAYSANLMNANYMYIPEFGRYYFIKSIETGMQRLFISAHVDVLMSFEGDIDKLTCVIERQEDPSKCDLYLSDKAFKSEARKNVSTRLFPGSFEKSAASFVLTTGGES